MNDIVKDIRRRCRLAMNGVASTSMRNKGLAYKLNFGVSLQKIREIASHYDKNIDVAVHLWEQDVRELKILATLLYPEHFFTFEKANEWVQQIPNQEIREQICLNLFQQLPFADQLLDVWTRDPKDEIRTTGYWLLVRLLMTKKICKPILLNDYPFIITDLTSEDVSLKNAALLSLKHIGRTSKDVAEDVLLQLAPFRKSSCPFEIEIYNSVEFEFDYYHNGGNSDLA